MKGTKRYVSSGRMGFQQGHGGIRMESSVSNMKMENGGTTTTVGSGIKKILEKFCRLLSKNECCVVIYSEKRFLGEK